MRRKLSWLAFFTRCKAKLPPEDQHERRCTCVRVQVEHNVSDYVVKFLNLNHLESLPPELREAPSENPDSAEIPSVKGRGNTGNTKTEYESLFLQPRKYDARITCRLDSDIRRHLLFMVKLLGDKGISVTCLMNNILYHHLQDHRAEINTLIENSTKKIKL